jgi:hypothetical protein
VLTAAPYPSQIQLYAATVTGPVRWRLLSGNNRELGRGADAYDDAPACRLAVEEIQLRIDELQPAVRRLHAAWTWQLERTGEVVASSGRRFDRLIRCEQNLAQFRARLADAQFSSTVMVSEARRWRTAAGM